MNRSSAMAFVLVGVAAVLGPLAPAHAADVKLLKAPSTFPLVISAPGSYRLKGNFTVPDENTTAISITADNVTLDLNGYTLSGPTVCTGALPVTCTPTGTGNGIQSTANNLTVLNGTVRGFGNNGVYLLGSVCRIERVQAISNGANGLVGGTACVVASNIAMQNGFHGVFADSSVMVGNVANWNGTSGIGGNDVLGMDNFMSSNSLYGVNFSSGSAYRDNALNWNNGGGVQAAPGGGTAVGHNVCSGSLTCP